MILKSYLASLSAVCIAESMTLPVTECCFGIGIPIKIPVLRSSLLLASEINNYNLQIIFKKKMNN